MGIVKKKGGKRFVLRNREKKRGGKGIGGKSGEKWNMEDEKGFDIKGIRKMNRKEKIEGEKIRGIESLKDILKIDGGGDGIECNEMVCNLREEIDLNERRVEEGIKKGRLKVGKMKENIRMMKEIEGSVEKLNGKKRERIE